MYVRVCIVRACVCLSVCDAWYVTHRVARVANALSRLRGVAVAAVAAGERGRAKGALGHHRAAPALVGRVVVCRALA